MLTQECVEVFKEAERLILRGRREGRRITECYDLACGQGLVGLLLTIRFTDLSVLSIDLERRNSYDAFVDSYRWAQHNNGGDGPSTERIRFVEGDFNDVIDGREPVPSTSLVLCVHGCNEANRDAEELATRHKATWMLVPCCIRDGLYLPRSKVSIPDDTVRYTILAGAMAALYDSETVTTIDSRISGKGIVLTGGTCDDSGRAIASPAGIAKRRTMPQTLPAE